MTRRNSPGGAESSGCGIAGQPYAAATPVVFGGELQQQPEAARAATALTVPDRPVNKVGAAPDAAPPFPLRPAAADHLIPVRFKPAVNKRRAPDDWVVLPAGIEPATDGLEIRCSIH